MRAIGRIMSTPSRISLLLFLSALASSSGVGRADELGPDGARALVELRRILPLEEILRRNEANLRGRVLELELERSHGHFYYQVRVLRPDGRIAKLKIDAENGSAIGAK
jgi:uncharacterized membrane protein YkoI